MKIALLGIGKMGQTIERLALEKGDEVVYKQGAAHKSGDLSSAEVAIEFSSPEAAFSNIEQAIETGIPVVSGTTGWLDRYQEMLKLCEARNGTLVYASNFSVGVNLFFALNRKLGQLMQGHPEYKASMEEVHHTQKLDAPSGTAISLAEDLLPYLPEDGWALGEADHKLAIDAQREGDVKGTHKIAFVSAVDSISIEHRAHTREGFAQGALLAAGWALNKKGVYSMADVLGIK